MVCRMQRLMELILLDTKRREALQLGGDETIVGRGRTWDITNVDVSRGHARFQWKAARTVDVWNDTKSIYIQRRTAKRPVEKPPKSHSLVKVGDVVYLLREDATYRYGFEIRRRDPSPMRPTKLRKANGIFADDRIVFLTRSHIATMREKVMEEGADVTTQIDPETTVAIVCDETTERFRPLYKEHPHVRFVKREFVSDSLAAGRRAKIDPYIVYRPTPEPPDVTSTHPSMRQGEPSSREMHAAAPLRASGVSVDLPSDYDWIEAYDVDKAQDTVNRLFHHWTHSAPTSDEMSGLSAASDAESDVSMSSPLHNDVCLHRACAALNVCFISELNDVKSHYHGRGAVSFKIKAIDTAIRTLMSLTRPLRDVQDIEKLKLGKKTKDKLKQVLSTGRIQRNVEMADDAQEQLLHTFSSVWGAGEASAQKWIAAGCQSLEDVQQRMNLTEIQRVGLLYYKEFQQRVPRAEVQSIYLEIKKCVIRAVARLTHLTVGRCQSQVFCAALGSFVRGKQETGDIDILISPPETSLDLTASDFLQEILNELLNENIITSDLHPDRLKRHKEASASWMGVCFSPDHTLHRRLDIKVYQRSSLPFAVNYFIGSRDFVRALRYWCIRPTEETANLAQKHFDRANAFRLSDHGLVLAHRETRRSPLEPVGRSILCTTETDIFRAVGLDYVPPWMRIFSQT